ELMVPTFRNPLNILKLFLHVACVDLVYTWFAGTNAFFSIIFSKLLRKKSLVVIGGYEVAYIPEINYGSLLRPFERVKVKFVLRHASMTLPVSRSTLKEMLRVCRPKKFKIVYNGVDVEKFKPLGSKENLAITVANVTESTIKKKGLDVFVKAATYFPEVPFVLIGKFDGSIKHLKEIAGSNVVFAGYLSDEPLLNYYRRAKVYCQLSAHESFGVALAEAMACGCVPVVTRKYALPEVVGDTGFYVPYNDPKATAEAIKKALKSNKGIKARERIKNCFPLKGREEKLVKEIMSLV
ncbi:MAG: glycosyltransferase family 4 protein, partial [Candidatus Bathycorpusculaceae bacterium]